MSVKNKLLFNFFIVAFLFIFLGVVSLISIKSINGSVDIMVNKNMPQQSIISQSVLTMEKSISNLKTFVMSYDDSKILVGNINSDLDQLSRYLKILIDGRPGIPPLKGENKLTIQKVIDDVSKLKIIINECVDVHDQKVDLHFELYSKIYDVEIYFYRLTNKDYNIDFEEWYKDYRLKNKKIQNYIDKYAKAYRSMDEEAKRKYHEKVIKTAARTLDMIEASERINFNLIMDEASKISSTLYIVQTDVKNQLLDSKRYIKDIYSNIFIFNILVMIAVVFGGLFITLSLSNSITRSLKSFQTSLLNFFKFMNYETKEIDLIKIESNDEFGEMFEVLNKNIVTTSNLHQELRELMETIDENIITSEIDSKGIITNVSRAFCKTSGFNKVELIGREFKEFIDKSDTGTECKEMFEAVKRGEVYKCEIRNINKDGSSSWLDMIASAKYDKNGDFNGITAIKYDINSKKEIEHLSSSLELKVKERTKELEKLNATLEERVKEEITKNIEKENQIFRQSKAASMGEMIGNISHQLKQPLSTLSMIANSIKADIDLNIIQEQNLSAYADDIIKQVEHQSDTIDTFRDYLREKKEKKRFALQERIDVIIRLVSAALKNNQIELKNNIQYHEKIEVESIPSEFSEVLINIINNAKDVLAAKNIKDPWIKLDIDKRDEKIIITIEDNGGGIPDDTISNIFDKYFTTKQNGTGLGLYMTHDIVKNSLKGDIWVQNTTNGAKFFIKL